MESLKEKRRAEFSEVATASHASLDLNNCKQLNDEGVISFIHRWVELLLQSCDKTAEQCRGKLKISPVIH